LSAIDLDKLRLRRDTTVAAPSRRRTRLRAWHGVAAGIALAVAARLVPTTAEVQTTQVVSAWPSQQFQLLNATGYVVAQRKASVSSKGTGRVAWLGVNEGDHVAAGALVARLENDDMEASYRAAQADIGVAAAALPAAENEVQDAQRNLDRSIELYKQHFVTLLNLQEAQTRMNRARSGQIGAKALLDAAKAQADVALSNLENTRIRAPFDGVVISRSANVGDIVTPLSAAADAKGAVLMMADMSSLEVDADVSESVLATIKLGQPCEIALDAFPDKRFRGEVAVVVPTVHRASATVTVKVRILDPDGSILPDMNARVAFLSQAVDAAQQHPVLALSPEAIAHRGADDVVFVVGSDDRLRQISVRPGPLLGTVRQVSGALKAGDNLVLNPGSGLKDGSAVSLAGTH
jgi:RND family efflux transporter MFP subunit